jgi:hypothetical protein
VATPALATPPGDRPSHGTTASGRTYLALGDSVPFGFIGNAESLYPDPDNFVGYPEMLADDLRLRVLNASCPGETTASFIDDDAQSNGCENSLTSPVGYRDRFPLHVQYDDSQLDYAVETLEEAPHVRLVTLQLGANDLFVCVSTGQCTTPAGCRTWRPACRRTWTGSSARCATRGSTAGGSPSSPTTPWTTPTRSAWP